MTQPPSQIQQLAAMETLRAAGWVFTGPAQGRLQLMTVAEVCAVLAFSRRHVERMLAQGEFPGAVHFGAEIRIPASDLEACIARQPRVYHEQRMAA